jgi:glyoxylase-like metal-dependent hydrolase (beta-lactamase superfamily II)
MAGYDQLRQVTPQAAVVLQDNPGPMTLDGTNTWLLGTDRRVVVDPGQGENPAQHVPAVLAAAGNISLIVLTHRHHDHAELAPALHRATGVPVRAADPALCLGAGPLADGEVLTAGDTEVQVLATPGHTSDSVCLVLDGGPVLTGDTVLGRGTTVVAHPDGALGPYLDSLTRLQELGDRMVLPGHGLELPSVGTIAAQYLAHRAERLDQVRAALELLGAQTSARQIVEHVYADVDESVWWAAELSVKAQLDYLRA